MEVILKADVRKLGHKNDIVKVKNGYANNYLFPQGLAVLATESAKKQLAETMKQRAHKEAKFVADAQALADKLAGVKLTIKAKVSGTGKIYGSVNNIQVAEALANAGFEIDRRKIDIKEGDKVTEIGEYTALIDLYRGVEGSVKFEVVDEEGKVKEVEKEEAVKAEPAPKKEAEPAAEETKAE